MSSTQLSPGYIKYFPIPLSSVVHFSDDVVEAVFQLPANVRILGAKAGKAENEGPILMLSDSGVLCGKPPITYRSKTFASPHIHTLPEYTSRHWNAVGVFEMFGVWTATYIKDEGSES